MTVSYLVDTDWIIHYLNGQPEIVSKLQELQGRGVAFLSFHSRNCTKGLTTPAILRPEKVISMIFLPAFPDISPISLRTSKGTRGRRRVETSISRTTEILSDASGSAYRVSR